ncbi:hypothetical protein ACIQVC_33415 [Streptomyces sp. NPDC101112]|uniref:hypothetical protein n=1 Tax=Streptomyces sp. NPDC101112 TaxID=3366105 RepID=UPI003811BCA0
MRDVFMVLLIEVLKGSEDSVFRKASGATAIALTIVLVAAFPAVADAKGAYSVKRENHSKAWGKYIVNERAGDTRVWFRGSLKKYHKSGCDYVQAGRSGAWKTLKKICGKKDSKTYNKYVTMGIFDSDIDYRLCHKVDDSVTCTKNEIRW